jgi:steroid delta-isomerase-like uncharacterized protein
MEVPLSRQERNNMLTAQDNATIVLAHYDAFNKREIDKDLALVTDDVKWLNIPFNVNFSGHQGYREYLKNWITAMPDCKVEVLHTVVGEEWAAVEFVGRGTHTGPLVGPYGKTFPATQKKLDLKLCEFLRIRDGQIAEARVYFDAATMMRQLGLPETPMPGEPDTSSR